MERRDFWEPLYDTGRLGDEVIIETSSPPDVACVGVSGGEPGIVTSVLFLRSFDLGEIALREAVPETIGGDGWSSKGGNSGNAFSSL